MTKNEGRPERADLSEEAAVPDVDELLTPNANGDLAPDLDEEQEPLPKEQVVVRRDAFLRVAAKSETFDDARVFQEIVSEMAGIATELLGPRSQQSLDQTLRKLRGDWFEWLLCLLACEVEQNLRTQLAAVLLPNVSRFDVAALYQERLAQMLADLRSEVQKNDVELITSNPDFVLIRRSLLTEDPAPARPLDANSLDWYVKRYETLAGRCGFEDIKGFLAAKYTLKPDRRLQIAHEGSLMKALYVHLQTRLWKTDPPGLKFYGVSTKVGPKDFEALRTVATHSITDVASHPQRAVDKVFEVGAVGEARAMFSEVLQ